MTGFATSSDLGAKAPRSDEVASSLHILRSSSRAQRGISITAYCQFQKSRISRSERSRSPDPLDQQVGPGGEAGLFGAEPVSMPALGPNVELRRDVGEL